MIKNLTTLALLMVAGWQLSAASALIVADEFPAMETLAKQLKQQHGIECQIVAQTNMPADLAGFQSVIVYIHKKLLEGPEMAFIKYAESGGRLVLLHHSISSGKRANKQWFSFIGVDLPPGEVDAGGYKWTEGITMDIVNLATNHYVTTHNVKYDGQKGFKPTDGPETNLPYFTLHETEVYLNHILKGDHHLLIGLRYTDAKTGKTWMQKHAGWYKSAGKGLLVYLLPGHSVREFEHPAYIQIVLNAVTFKP